MRRMNSRACSSMSRQLESLWGATGRYVCVARKPKCATCVVGDLCPSRELFL